MKDELNHSELELIKSIFEEYGKNKYGWIGDVPRYKLNNSLIKKNNLFPKNFSNSLNSVKKTIKDII